MIIRQSVYLRFYPEKVGSGDIIITQYDTDTDTDVDLLHSWVGDS